jgi:hypothetical protein
MSSFLAVNQSTTISTPNMQLILAKSLASGLQNVNLTLEQGSFELPSFCDLMSSRPDFDCANQQVVKQVWSFASEYFI